MDQNNMGGFAPMPGQVGANNGNGAMPVGAPIQPAMPGVGMPQAGGMAPNAAMPGMPGMPNNQANAAGAKASSPSLGSTLALIGACLVAAAAIVCAVIFFMQYNELEKTFETEKSTAVAKAVAEQSEADTAKYAEEAKLPYSKFTGPSDYGTISFEYPKTWSAYIKSDGLNNSDFVSYFHPMQVDSIDDKSSRYSLRFSILNQQFTTVQQSYDKMIEKGLVSSSVFNADNNKISGTKYVGQIGDEMQGIVVVFKVNDKTAILQTDSMVYQADFETLLSKLRRNS